MAAAHTVHRNYRDARVRRVHAMEKQGKRKAVPAALHSELSEYASLLRVLRTTDTLDISAQLTRPDPQHASREELFVNEEEIGCGEASASHAHSSTTPPARNDRRSSSRGASVLPGKPRDTWTRWPLLAGDIHIPEWDFEDEVYSLARQSLLLASSNPDHVPIDCSARVHDSESEVPTDDEAEAALPPSSVRVLADVSSHHLERVLAALAAYVPIAEKSAQNRHNPIGWESVLNIVSAAGLADSK
ncbi:hypothetical protein BC834DRAFT_79514 [Gloeopeniophorella convolvens]|nr:hypothetical protein BC834DRAFT_79514 [Gloeopeniophorella convolvens]